MAKKKKEKNYGELSVEELERQLEKSKEDLFKLRFRSVSGPQKNTMQIQNTRREIARLLTFIQQRRQAV